MSTTETTNNNSAAPPPAPPAPEFGGNSRFYKVSNGEVKYKPDRDSDWEMVDFVEGRFQRVGVQVNEFDGEEIHTLEVELVDRENRQAIVQVSLQNSVGCGMLAAAVLELAEGEWVAIKPSPSKEKNKWGKYTTFVNVQVFHTNTQKWAEIRPNKDNWTGESWGDRLDAVLEDLGKHPAYKVRERKERDSGSGGPEERHLFEEMIKAKGWPAMRGDGEGAWLKDFSAGLGRKLKSLDEMTEDEWNLFRRELGPEDRPGKQVDTLMKLLEE